VAGCLPARDCRRVEVDRGVPRLLEAADAQPAEAARKSRIEPDSLQSVVVFVGAKVDDLELDGENLRRICTIERLPGYLRERAAAAQVSPLAVQQVLRRYEQVAALDRSEDPSVQRRHAEYRGGAVEPLAAPATAGAEGSGGAPAPLPPQVTWSGNPHRSWSPPPKVDSGSSWSCAGQFGAVAGILAVALLILFGPYLLGQVVGWLGAMASRGPSIFGGVISQAAGSVRPWNWPAAFVAALSFGAAAGLGLWIANGAFGRSFGGRVFEGSVALVARVLQGVFAVAFFVAFMGFLLVALSPQSHASVGAPTLTQAQQALRQVQPAVYGQVADLQSPEVVTDAETTTYTFHVLKKTSTKSATAQAYSVTLGRDGTLRSHKP